MAGSIFGEIFSVATWGESHGKGLGVVVDGCPAGVPLTEEDVQRYLDRRKPGETRYSTPRKEGDKVEILSGVFEGKTTGTPISMIVLNTSQKSRDYSEIASYYRPGHADYTFDEKYGFRDYRGGGRSSGRETIGRVAGGAVASKILAELGIEISSYVKSIGDIEVDPEKMKLEDIEKSPLRMPDLEASERAEEFLADQMRNHDSAGGVIECVISGVPAGIGDPVFGKLDALRSAVVLRRQKKADLKTMMNFVSIRMEKSVKRPTLPEGYWEASVTGARLYCGQLLSPHHLFLRNRAQ